MLRNDIYVMNADGGGRTLLTTGMLEGTNPAWSPDGKRIAFVSWNDEENTALFFINADGSNVSRLTAPDGMVEHDDPTWSPDGKQIAFTAWGAGEAGTSEFVSQCRWHERSANPLGRGLRLGRSLVA